MQTFLRFLQILGRHSLQNLGTVINPGGRNPRPWPPLSVVLPQARGMLYSSTTGADLSPGFAHAAAAVAAGEVPSAGGAGSPTDTVSPAPASVVSPQNAFSPVRFRDDLRRRLTVLLPGVEAAVNATDDVEVFDHLM